MRACELQVPLQEALILVTLSDLLLCMPCTTASAPHTPTTGTAVSAAFRLQSESQAAVLIYVKYLQVMGST